MTNDPLIQLREQLVMAAERLADARTGAPAGGQRGRIRRRGVWLTLAGLLVVVPTVAAATGIVGFSQSTETQGRKIALQAVKDTETVPACIPARRREPGLSDGAPLPEITAALPALATPVTRREQARALATLPHRGGTVLRRTVRTINFRGDVQLTVFVQTGRGFGELRDPRACGQARRERANELTRDRSAEVKRWAQRRLAELRDTTPGLQTLTIIARAKGSSSSVGSGTPVRRGQQLRRGLLMSGSAGRRRGIYVGLASPRATAVHLAAKKPGARANVPARVRVRGGLWAVVLTNGTGPIAVREVAADGAVLRTSMLRE